MSKGPRFNNINRQFTTRNSLGIEGVSASIQGEICPVVNSVTPRPFYWAFIIWCYYDFYKMHSSSEWDETNVYKYIKKQNYFLALGSALNQEEMVNNFTGRDSISKNENLQQDRYNYNEKYIESQKEKYIGNMTYYPPGLKTMDLLREEDPENQEKYKYVHITKDGEQLAKAFENVISTTRYYQEYRLSGKDVPREVLIELNETVKINLDGFDEVKKILIEHLFNKKRTQKLRECHDYVKYISSNEQLINNDQALFRRILFDYYSPRGVYRKQYPDNLRHIVNEWELVIGRQYFTAGLELIWEFMLENLETIKSKNKWFDDCICSSKFKMNIDDSVGSILNECNFEFEEREQMIKQAQGTRNSHEESIDNGLKIILSVYNRFKDRFDYTDYEKKYFYYGQESSSISFNEFFELVDEYKEKTIRNLLRKIMSEYLLKQHLDTAFKKMLEGRNGYFIEKIENEYIKEKSYEIKFQGIIMVQLVSVMTDLNLLENE